MKNIFNQKAHSSSFILLAFSLLLINCQNAEISSSKFDLEKLNQIDNLINTQETMLICMKFKDLKHWRIFNI